MDLTLEYMSKKYVWTEPENLEQLKERFKAHEIDRAAFDRLRMSYDVRWFDNLRANYINMPDTYIDPETPANEAPWWVKREWARVKVGHYMEPTTVVSMYSKHMPAMCLHISRDDPTMVAYTPDYRHGMEDRKVKTTLGRYLAKYYPHLPDHKIAELEAKHRGELSTDDVLFVRGPDIVSVYEEAKSGVTSCMTKSWEKHPCMAYDSPQIAMAILRDAKGKLTARCMIVEMAGEKRYIRGYGDNSLIVKLKRLGYVAGGWQGVKFSTVPYSDEDAGTNYRKYVFPYLDANGGMASGDGSQVALIDGQITGVTLQTANKLKNIHSDAASYGSSSGYMFLRELDQSEFHWTCPFSKKVYNLLDEPINKAKMLIDGKVVEVAAESVPSEYRALHTGTHAGVMAAPDVPSFTYGSRRYMDTIDTRMYAGFTKLNVNLYPDEQEWIEPYNGVKTVEYKNTDTLIKKEDAIRVAVREGDFVNTYNYHKSEYDAAWVKLHSIHKGENLYTDDPSLVLKTDTGRKVVKGVHDISTTWDGKVMFDRQVTSSYIMNIEVVHDRKVRPATSDPKFLDYAFATLSRKNIFSWLVGYSSGQFRNLNGDRLRDYDISKENTKELILHNAKVDYDNPAWTKLRYEVTMEDAEANALDYSINQQPYVPFCYEGLSLEDTRWILRRITSRYERSYSDLTYDFDTEDPYYSPEWYVSNIGRYVRNDIQPIATNAVINPEHIARVKVSMAERYYNTVLEVAKKFNKAEGLPTLEEVLQNV